MAQRRTPGLVKRGNIWHIRKQIKGYGRLNESTGTSDYAEAERHLAHRLNEIRRAVIYGDRPQVLFRDAAAKFIEENTHLKSLDRTAMAFDAVMPYIGDKYLEQVHDDSLRPYVKHEQKRGISNSTINRNLDAVRRVLTLAARKWRHPNGMTYLATAPLISRLPETSKRKPYPLTWDEQARLLPYMPRHLANMVLFALNTGLRDENVTGLRWEWEVYSPELGETIFLIPAEYTKGGALAAAKGSEEPPPQVVFLNSISRSIIEAERGKHAEYVFTYDGHRVDRMLNTSFKKARVKAGLPHLRVHDLRHTFGHRLAAAGVSLEDRKTLLGHRQQDITTHYSAADLQRLRDAVRAIEKPRRTTMLRVVAQNRHNVPPNPQRSVGDVASG